MLQPALRSKISNARLLPAVSTISVQFSVLKLNLSKGKEAYRKIKKTDKYIYIKTLLYLLLYEQHQKSYSTKKFMSKDEVHDKKLQVFYFNRKGVVNNQMLLTLADVHAIKSKELQRK